MLRLRKLIGLFLLVGATVFVRAENTLSIADTTVIAGDTVWVRIDLTNQGEAVGFQFDLAYPSAINYAGVSVLSNRSNGHELVVSENGPYLRFLAYNLGLQGFSGSEGTILSIGFTTEADYGSYSIALVNPVIGDVNSDNILTSYDNGTLIIASPEPQLSPFSLVTINEDSTFGLTLDMLKNNAYDANTDLDDLEWSFNASHLTVTESLDGYTVTPDLNWYGRDTIQITASDGLYEGSTYLPVRVQNVNDLPTQVLDIPYQIFNEDNDRSLDLVPYFFDADGSLMFGVINGSPTVETQTEGSIITFSPESDWFGGTNVVVYATDAIDTITATINLVVEAVNDPIQVLNIIEPQTGLEDSVILINLANHFIDIDSDIVYSIESNPSKIEGTVFEDILTLSSEINWFGTTDVTLRANDGEYESILAFELNLLPVNDTPIQIDSIYSQEVLEDNELKLALASYFSDVDSDISYSAQSSAWQVSPTLSNDTLIISPQQDWFGSAAIHLTFSDDEFSKLVLFDFEVISVNDAPLVVENISDQIIFEDEELVISLNTYFRDVDSDMNYSIMESDYFSFDILDQELTVTPDVNWYGTTMIEVTADDSELFVSSQFQMIVNAVNDPPEPTRLISPLNEIDIVSNDILLEWESPFDVDSDILHTTVYIQYQNSTISFNIDTIGFAFNMTELQLPYDEVISWWVVISDGLLSSQSASADFEVPISFKYNGPVWHISKEGDLNISDGSGRYPYLEIHQGIESANSLDTVLIQPGTYHETINFFGKDIVVGSLAIYNASTDFIRQTIIDTEGSARCATFTQGETNDAQLNGLTISNGYSSSVGAGIHINGSSPTIKRCVVSNNISYSGGAGISIENSNSIIENCTIVNNTSQTSPNNGDGGVMISSQSIENQSEIKNTIIYDNNTLHQYVDRTGNMNLNHSLLGSIYPNDLTVGNSNILNTDPLWVNPLDGDYILQYDSECVDAGNPDNDDDGLSWVFDEDDWDPDGTRLDMGALYLEQNDSIPPSISILYPNGGEAVRSSEPVTILWSAEDDRVLTWAKIFYSINGGGSYTLIDSVYAGSFSYDWIPEPNTLTETARIRILISDRGDNITFDATDGYFSIADGSPPAVIILSPDSTSSFAEHEPIYVSWVATDNVLMDSIFIDYSKNDGNLYSSLLELSSNENNISFDAPFGMTPFAKIRVKATDINNNSSFTESDPFEITDNTPPNVNLLSPEYGSIGLPLVIQWSATDNSFEFSNHSLWFSADPDSEFVFLDSISGAISTAEWIPGNLITDSSRIKIISTDRVGLSDTDTSEYFFIIDEVPPIISILSPESDFTIPENTPLTVSWYASDNQEMDSMKVFYSNSGEDHFQLVGQASSDLNEITFILPFGVTQNAQLKLIGYDIYGNAGIQYSENFNVSDNSIPEVTINSPGDVGTQDTVQLFWDANDNTGIFSNSLYFSADNGLNYSFIDSILNEGESTRSVSSVKKDSNKKSSLNNIALLYHGIDLHKQSINKNNTFTINTARAEFEYSWVVPDIVSDEVLLKIISYDSIGLSSEAISEDFIIYDNVDPVIELTFPQEGFVVLENELITVEWEVTDNIGIDRVSVHYSNNGGETYSFITQQNESMNQIAFNIPSGVTQNAIIRLVAMDSFGNEGQDEGLFFEVTDNTPPTINLSAPEDVAIGQSLNINWTASDNTVLRSNHLYYSQQPGYEFVFIDSVAGNETNYSWVAPNFVSNQVRVIVETFDNVNLSTADTSSFFLIFDNTPPEINILTPVDGFIVPEFEPLSVTWIATDNIEMDSVRIYFSNDNGNNFISVGEVPHSTAEYEFLTPSGITNSAQLRLDAIDIYGNVGQIFSDLFSVSDNTPPDVTIENFPSLHIGEEAIIYWSSNDNTGIDFHRLFLSTDNGDSYSQIDSVSGGDSSLSWIVPNIATENALLSIFSTDLVGLSDSDTTLVFSILDGINPQVTVSEFEENYSIPEFQPITIEWNASDNILLDSAKVWYSPNNGEEFVYVGIGLATSSSFTFYVPQGLTHQGLIKVEVYDVAQNVASDTSDVFTVTDYTPPVANILSPVSGNRFDIDGTMEINWDAYDNVMVSRIDISYSTDLGQNWESIFSDLPNTGISTWTVLNDPSDVVQLRIIAFDDVGLSDTSIVKDLAIDIVYPQVLDLFPEPGPISWLDQSITISFNQMMLPEGFNEDFIRFVSMHSDSISGSFSYIDSIQSLRIDLSNGFSGLDTVTIILDADGVNNYYGYPLDGNGDGVGGDDYSFEYQIGMIGDYNADQVINGSDLSIFISSWNDNDYLNELGPYSGVVPNIVVDPDDNFNIEDVMSFVVLGNWYLSNFGLAVSNQKLPSMEMSYEVNEKSIKVLLPEDAMVYELQVSYDINSFKSDFKQSEEHISLIQNNNELGILNVISQIKQNKTVYIPFETQNKNTSIQLYVQTYDEYGKVLSSTLEVLDIHAIPDEFVLNQNYPNPFNPVTHIEYGLPQAGHVDLVLYDILGKEVLTLLNEIQEPGYKTISWNGKNQGGFTVGAGMYFYVLKLDNTTKIKKMLFLK